MEKSPKERTKILAKAKLYFKCNEPMTENHDVKSCKQRLVCRLCFELHSSGMHDYMKRKTNEDRNNTKPRELGTDTVKCDSVNGKLDTEIINTCIPAVWVGHMSSSKW